MTPALPVRCACSVAQSRPTVCTPWTPGVAPGSFVHGIFQARVLERVPLPYSRDQT